MKITLLQKISLGVAGVTSVSIGAFIAAAPYSFYASYGIVLGSEPNLLSELRAPGAALAAFGILMLVGISQTAMIQVSKTAALAVFLSFPAGRIIGLIVDGLPSGPIFGALVFELAVAVLCLVAFGRCSELEDWQHSGARAEHLSPVTAKPS